jgi:hypothetical protein
MMIFNSLVNHKEGDMIGGILSIINYIKSEEKEEFCNFNCIQPNKL